MRSSRSSTSNIQEQLQLQQTVVKKEEDEVVLVKTKDLDEVLTNVHELGEMVVETSRMLSQQEEMINNIDNNVENANGYLKSANKDIVVIEARAHACCC